MPGIGLEILIMVSQSQFPMKNSPRLPVVFSAALLLLGGCFPALNWRQATVLGAPLRAHFPCSPEHSSRRLAVAAQTLNVGLSSCKANAQTFALIAIDMQEPSRVVPGQLALRQMAEQNFGGQVEAMPDRTIAGSPLPRAAQQLSARLMRPDKTALQARMLFFSHGSWVFQATVIGEQPKAEAVDFFFDNLLIATHSP